MRDVVRHISNHRLLEAIAVVDSMLKAIHLGKRNALQRSAELIGKFLKVENCAIFLIPGDGKERILELEGSCNPFWLMRLQMPIRIPIRGSISDNLTGFVAQKKQSKVLNYEDLLSLDHAGFNRPISHLRSKDGKRLRFSFLAIPLLEEDGTLIGLLKCENKFSGNSPASSNDAFSEEDLAVATLFANRIVSLAQIGSVTHATNLFNIAGRLVELMQKGRDTLLDDLLVECKQLFRADRADFAWWSPEQGDLIWEKGTKLTKHSRYADGKPVAQASLTRYVFEQSQRGWEIIYDCTDKEQTGRFGYFRGDKKTKSNIAVVVATEGFKAGVLNLESYKKERFDDYTAEQIQVVTRHAAAAMILLQTEGLTRKVLESTGDGQKFLQPILDTALETCGFDEGILYWHDEREQTLQVGAWRSSVGKPPGDLRFPLGEPSFASWIVNEARNNPERAWPEIEKDAHADSLRRFDVRMRTNLQVRGSVLGYPLRVSSNILGCLILWMRHRSFPDKDKIDVVRLDDLAHLAAAKLALTQAELARRENETLYRLITEQSPLMVCTLRKAEWTDAERAKWRIQKGEPKFVIDYVNFRWLAFMGIDAGARDTIIGRTDWDLFPEEYAKEYYRDDLEVFHGTRIDNKFEVNVDHRDPTNLRYVAVWKSVIKNHLNESTGIHITFVDRSAEVRRTQSQELIERDLRHRLHSGLDFVRTYLNIEQYAPSTRALDPEVAQSVGHILRDCNRRIANLDRLMRLLYGSALSYQETVNMRTLLGELALTVELAYERKGVEVILDEVTNKPLPLIEARICGLIVSELLANSLEHGYKAGDTGTVMVRLRETAHKSFELCVTDDGKGFKTKNRPDAQTTTGLALISAFAEDLGSQAQFAPSRSQGREGITCAIRFRLEGHLRPHRLRKARLDRVNVLIVEDAAEKYIETKNILEANNYFVLGRVGSKEAAIRAVVEDKPDILILDIWLGREEKNKYDGIEVVNMLRSAGSRVPIVLTTSVEDAGINQRLADLVNVTSLIRAGDFARNLIHNVEIALLRRITGRKIFVCYSRKEQHLKNELDDHLAIFQHESSQVEAWSDQDIESASDWKASILRAIESSAAAILLVNAPFAASKFIQHEEIPRLLMNWRNKGMLLYIVETSACHAVPELLRFMDTHTRPMRMRKKAERAVVWNAIVVDIRSKLGLIEAS